MVDGRHDDSSPVRNLSKELAVMGGQTGGYDDDKGHDESSEEEDVETESPASSLSDSDDGEEDKSDLVKAPNAAEKSRELLVVDLDDEDAIAIRLLDLAIQAALRIQNECVFF